MLIKDNHLALFGGETGVARAIAEAQRTAPGGTVIEVEVTGLEAALAAARAGADIILLDNMSCAAMAEVVGAIAALPAPRPALEASGGITLETLAEVAKTGVTRISVGALTHSALALDIALDVEIEASTKNP